MHMMQCPRIALNYSSALFTEARSLSQTQNWPIGLVWLLSVASLFWDSCPLSQVGHLSLLVFFMSSWGGEHHFSCLRVKHFRHWVISWVPEPQKFNYYTAISETEDVRTPWVQKLAHIVLLLKRICSLRGPDYPLTFFWLIKRINRCSISPIPWVCLPFFKPQLPWKRAENNSKTSHIWCYLLLW